MLFFSEFSCRGLVSAEFGPKIFFLPFPAYLIQFWLEILPERGFLIFWIFCYFFWNFLAGVEYERNSGLKFFSLFLGLSHPVLAKNIAGKRFFKCFEFFCYFFWNFLAEVEYERNSGLKFFSPLLGLSDPVLAKNNAEKGFLNFLNFFAIFFGIFLPWSSISGIRA